MLPEVLSRNPADEFNKLVDRHQLLRSQIDWLRVVGFHDTGQSIDAVPDITEASRLFAVPPDLDRRALLRFRDFSADCGGRLLPAPFVGSQRSVDVVKANHMDAESVVFTVVGRELLREELLPAISLLRIRGDRVLFPKAFHGFRMLQEARVHAGRRAV